MSRNKLGAESGAELRWLEVGELDAGEISRFRERTQLLSELYHEHIAVEDNELFPLAASALPGDALAAIGREMAERRRTRGPSPLAASSINQSSGKMRD